MEIKTGSIIRTSRLWKLFSEIKLIEISENTTIDIPIKKIKIFLIGITMVVFSEISVNFISENNFHNLIVLTMLPILICVSYLIFINRVKFSS